jgi:hypothetical protein
MTFLIENEEAAGGSGSVPGTGAGEADAISSLHTRNFM